MTRLKIVVAVLVLGIAGSFGADALAQAVLDEPGSIWLSFGLGFLWGIVLTFGVLETWPSRWDR